MHLGRGKREFLLGVSWDNPEISIYVSLREMAITNHRL